MQGFPFAEPGQVIGLLGGSFDPAHAGHAHITREAIKRFGLDRVWWLVSPGNPLKSEGPAPLRQRMDRAARIMDDPRVVITDLESRLGTRYTAQTLARLLALYPGVRFVWLMGADNMVQLHRWQDWRRIMEGVPVGVIARPGCGLAARRSKAARRYAHARVDAALAHDLGRRSAPAWCFADIPLAPHSSTDIRARGAWTRSEKPPAK